MEEDQFTYATLRKIERLEHTSPRLQKLEAAFWARMGEHLDRLRQAFHDQQEDDPISRRTIVLADELRNTMRLAESIWAQREKKVVQSALAAARRVEGRVDPPDHVTPEEKRLWEESLAVLERSRGGVLKLTRRPASVRIQGGQQATSQAAAATAASAAPTTPQAGDASQPSPTASHPETAAAAEGQAASAPAPSAAQQPQAPGREVTADVQGADRSQAGTSVEDEPAGHGPGAPDPAGEARQVEGGAGLGGAGEDEVALRLVWAIEDVPPFAGRDLVTYSMSKGEVGNLPAVQARILEERGIVRLLPDDEAAALLASDRTSGPSDDAGADPEAPEEAAESARSSEALSASP